jgi:hypothetical protein
MFPPTVRAIGPTDIRSDSVNELDFRVAKILRLGRTRANVARDLFNALNLDTIHFSKPGVRPGRGVAGADRQGRPGDDGANREDHGTVRRSAGTGRRAGAQSV